MDNQIQHIELINNYLNKTLSEGEVRDFESRLKSDADFNTLFEEHTTILEGLKRQQLRSTILNAKKAYIKGKWFKFLGITLSLATVLFAVLYFNESDSEKDYLKNMMNFESEYIQNFQVDIDSIIEIVGEKGTIIRFSPDDLETKSKRPFTGDYLNIELLELVNKQDLLFANTQTRSDGKWLISGGAFKIHIKANDEALTLKEDKTINVILPKSTDENNMGLFYGERALTGNMNWKAEDVKFESDERFVIFYEDTLIIDAELTRSYGLEATQSVLLVDTIGYKNFGVFKEQFPRVNNLDVNSDTLRIFNQRIQLVQKEKDQDYPLYDFEAVYVDSLRQIVDNREILIDSKQYLLDNVLPGEGNTAFATIYWHFTPGELGGYRSIVSSDSLQKFKKERQKYFEVRTKFNQASTQFYKEVQLSNLGWINIDKFAPTEEKVNIKFKFNIDANHNEIRVIDQRNNTVLNVYDDEIDLPVNRGFYIIALGIKGKDIYGFKRSVRVNKSGNLKVDYKKINESQIRSMLTLESVEKSPVVDSVKQEKPRIKEASVETKPSEIKKEITEVKIPKKTSQTFKFNSKKDTTITCKEDTQLRIKANAFVDQNNKEVTGKVDLRVVEYYELSDILLANLSTQSDGNLLETGGMLNLQAFHGDKPLSLKPNAPIEILFPGQKKDMKLFSGEWNDGMVNWKLCNVEQEIEPVIEEIEVIEEDIDVPFSVVEEVPVYPGCEQGDRTQRRNCTSKAIKEFVQRKFNTELADKIGLNGRQRINVIFKINKNGDIVDIRSRAPEPELELEAERVIASLPKMLPGKQRGKAVSVPYSLPIVFDAKGIPSVGRGRSAIRSRLRDSLEAIRNARFEARLTGTDSNLGVSEVNSYILRTSKLGWINCDRFVRTGNRIKYKLKINEAKGVTRVSMVFKSMNSVLSGRRSGKTFDFNLVPKNEDVVLIAIKKDEGKLYFDMVDAKTVENPSLEFNFKEVDLETLKRALEELNEDF